VKTKKALAMSLAHAKTDSAPEGTPDPASEPFEEALAPSREIQAILGLDSEKTWFAAHRPMIILTVVAVLAAAGIAYWWLASSAATRVEYTTVPVSRGDLTVTVSAAGALDPVNQVEIGSELSGTVRTVAVDYNDRVDAGQVLARLDTAKLDADVSHAKAALKAAEANLVQAEATVSETKGNLERASSLFAGQHQSARELEAAQAAYDRAVAARDSAAASIDLAAADLDADKTQRAKTDITSPIGGVVLERNVEPGQTVAATLQAPVLFTIAEDLSKMELLVDIDEADAAHVHEGAAANFVVEAYPHRDFSAEVIQLRYAPKSTSGVVTYEAVLAVDNSDLALRPGMTATATIVARRVDDALRVPNAALRYSPDGTAASTQFRGPFSFLYSRDDEDGGRPLEAAIPEGQRRIFELKEGEPAAVLITPGVSGGTWTEVAAGGVGEGTPIITDSTAAE
jgi:HlyD family secretion protein